MGSIHCQNLQQQRLTITTTTKKTNHFSSGFFKRKKLLFFCIFFSLPFLVYYSFFLVIYHHCFAHFNAHTFIVALNPTGKIILIVAMWGAGSKYEIRGVDLERQKLKKDYSFLLKQTDDGYSNTFILCLLVFVDLPSLSHFFSSEAFSTASQPSPSKSHLYSHKSNKIFPTPFLCNSVFSLKLNDS
jgi:hypothetical protein